MLNENRLSGFLYFFSALNDLGELSGHLAFWPITDRSARLLPYLSEFNTDQNNERRCAPTL